MAQKTNANKKKQKIEDTHAKYYPPGTKCCLAQLFLEPTKFPLSFDETVSRNKILNSGPHSIGEWVWTRVLGHD